MRYDNECGKRALGIYADHEHVVVAKELLTEIINQILEDGEKDDLDEIEVHDYAVSGLMLLFTDVASTSGYLRLAKDIQDLAVNYNFADRV